MRSRELAAFIKERENVRVAKERGQPRPWTKDPILHKYRFCNVHREHDRVSRWLRDNWYPAFSGNPDIWFAAVVARLFNLPESLEAVQRYTLPFDAKSFANALHRRKDVGLKNFNAAYIVSTNGKAVEKVEYIVEYVLKPLWTNRSHLRSIIGRSLQEVHERLMNYDGLGSFMAAQVVADLKYLPPLDKAPDWWTFVASGPGSRRGLNRVMGFPVNDGMGETCFRAELAKLANDKFIKPLNLHAQDLQNCLCEFDKYERAKDGGAPKQIYKERSID